MTATLMTTDRPMPTATSLHPMFAVRIDGVGTNQRRGMVHTTVSYQPSVR